MYRHVDMSHIAIPRHFGVENFGLPHSVHWTSLDRWCPSAPTAAEGAGVTRSGNLPWRFSGVLNELQIRAVQACMDAFDRHRGCILSLFCGGGKTVCALYLAAMLRRKTLVIVGKSFLCEQWEERVRQFMPAARVGRIRQDAIDVAGKDVVIGMLQSLVARGEEYPTQDFGMVIVDECHHICARTFSRALFTIGAPLERGRRVPAGWQRESELSKTTNSCDVCLLGLSATPERKDGLTECLNWFFGPMAFCAGRAASQMHGVKVHCRRYNNPQPKRSHPAAHFAEDISNLVADPARNELICDEITRAFRAGRKTLLLSDRREHLETLRSLLCARSARVGSSSGKRLAVPLQTVGFYVGGMKGPALDATAKCSVILATYGMCCEGLDVPALNTLLLATPRADVTQSVGRILRSQDTVSTQLPAHGEVWRMYSQ